MITKNAFTSWLQLTISILLLFCHNSTLLCAATEDEIDTIWKEYRYQHPYGFQAVALKHVGEESVIIISEPSEDVKETTLRSLIQRYQGNSFVKHMTFGYDGWLADFIACVKFDSDETFNQFTEELFITLYGTCYKAHYVDLDTPKTHTYFARQNLNFSVTASEIEKWMLIDSEIFVNSNGLEKNISQILSDNLTNPNELWYSSNRGFVIWCFDSHKSVTGSSFKENARKFALDTDLIIGAIGHRGSNFAIIARERNVSTDVLPPLRVETMHLLATTTNNQLAQSYERYNVFAGKTSLQQDFAPIYLSDELWHTEYGNLLNLTDQMLKSWSENGTIEYSTFIHPKPIDWAFNSGAVSDLNSTELTYNWNTAGAGYVIQGDNDFDIYAVNRTGSLPVSYIPGGMEGKVDASVNEAEELAYDFFSELNSPELVRVVQYASLYQIFRYYVDESAHNNNRYKINPEDLQSKNGTDLLVSLYAKGARHTLNKSSQSYPTPDYSCLVPYVEKILRLASDGDNNIDSYLQNAKDSYYQKVKTNNPNTRLRELSLKDDGDKIVEFMRREMGSEYIDSLLNNPPTYNDIIKGFDEYLNPNMNKVKNYISNYTKTVGDFPFSEAANYIINPRKLSHDIEKIYNEENVLIKEYSARVDAYNEMVDEYNSLITANNKAQAQPLSTYLSLERFSIDELEKVIKKKRKENEIELLKLSALYVDSELSKSFAALNWLLTDPDGCTEPIGDFYSRLFYSNHNHWIKSPSLACSYNTTGYGGHNLDAHVTPIRFEKNLQAGKCKVSIVDGQRIVSVSKADRAKVTPSVLRQIERRISEDQEIVLPEVPKERSRDCLFEEMNNLCNERGLSVSYEIAEVSLDKNVSINNVDCGTLDDLYSSIGDAIKNGSRLPVKEIRYKEMSAREVHIQVDNLREYILERTIDDEAVLNDFDINAIESRIDENGQAIISLPQNNSSIPENTFKAGKMEFKVPAGSVDMFKSVIKKVHDMPEEKINNHFKMMHQIKLELQNHPEIRMEDVKDEYIRLYGYILNCNEKYFTHFVA